MKITVEVLENRTAIHRRDKRRFSRPVEKEEQIYRDALEIFQSEGTYAEHMVQFRALINAQPRNRYHAYTIDTYSTVNNKITDLAMYENHYEGLWIYFTYRGLDYYGYALTDGTIVKIEHRYDYFRESSSGYTRRVPNITSLEKVNEQCIDWVNHDRRQIMNYYNKALKELKGEYRDHLVSVNAVIKMNEGGFR